MCTTAPCRVLRIDDASAVVDQRGRERTVLLLAAGEPVTVGDWVLVHAGLVVRRMDESEATATNAVWAELEDER
jgi:hydrogenase expression/formation protein HypC